jgi:prephenate dehydrogenase
MPLFKKASVIGTGLIGGSLALELRRRRLSSKVVGVSRHKNSIAWARRIGAIDSGSQDLKIVKGSDLVIIATPVESVIALAPKIAQLLDKDCLVTDVGSTKAEIVKTLEKLFPNYVGSHPMAGSEKRGVKSARKNLFKGALCILTPTARTKARALNKISSLWKKIGSATVMMTPDTHDKVLSLVSHIPHVVAFSLIASVPDKYLRFASGGLKDTTRIASSDSELWTQIFLSNRANIATNLSTLQKEISRIKSAINRSDKRELNLLLKRAKEKRNRLL